MHVDTSFGQRIGQDLIWSSVVEPGASAKGRDFEHNSQDHRIWYCCTADFRSFSAPAVFFDPGHSVIDATVREADGGGFLMALGDERGSNDLGTAHKDIHLATFDTPGGPFSAPWPGHSPVVEEPSFFRHGGELVMIFDHFLEGRYGAARSKNGVDWEPVSLGLPAGMLHASVLEMSALPSLTKHTRVVPPFPQAVASADDSAP